MSMLIESQAINHESVNAVTKIVNIIRLEHDYAKAAIALQDSGLTLSQLTSMTLRLSIFDIAKLADELVKI